MIELVMEKKESGSLGKGVYKLRVSSSRTDPVIENMPFPGEIPTKLKHICQTIIEKLDVR